MICQFRTRFVQNYFRSIHTKTLLYDWYGYEIKMMTKSLVHLKKESITLIQELRYTITVYQLLDTFCQFLTITNLRRFVQHLHQELFVLWPLYHNGIFMLFFTFLTSDGLFTRVIKLQYPFLHFGDSRSVVHSKLMLMCKN